MQTGYPCPYCGFTDHPEDANYCGNCGKAIKFIFNTGMVLHNEPFIVLHELSDGPILSVYNPMEFTVVEKNKYIKMSDKITKIQDFIKVEQQSNKKLFGGKSKTEILNKINDILS